MPGFMGENCGQFIVAQRSSQAMSYEYAAISERPRAQAVIGQHSNGNDRRPADSESRQRGIRPNLFQPRCDAPGALSPTSPRGPRNGNSAAATGENE
jgi:hypothetical protein